MSIFRKFLSLFSKSEAPEPSEQSQSSVTSYLKKRFGNSFEFNLFDTIDSNFSNASEVKSSDLLDENDLTVVMLDTESDDDDWDKLDDIDDIHNTTLFDYDIGGWLGKSVEKQIAKLEKERNVLEDNIANLENLLDEIDIKLNRRNLLHCDIDNMILSRSVHELLLNDELGKHEDIVLKLSALRDKLPRK